MPSPRPENETERLGYVHSCRLLDTEPEPAYDDIVKLAAVICEVPIATVTLVDAHRQWYKARIGLTARETDREVSFCSWTVASDELLVVEDAREDLRFRDNPTVVGPPYLVFYAGAVVRAPSGHALGTVCVLDHEPRKLNRMQLACLEALARQVGALVASRIDNQRLEQFAEEISMARTLLEARSAALQDANVQLERLANTDGLTGLLNRRCLMQRAEGLSALASPTWAMAVILADVDHFKAYNDTYGHLAGDEVLRQLAEVLRGVTRESDLIGRYGGEEFCLILPGTAMEEALVIGERLRRAVAHTKWPRRAITLSVGVALVSQPDQFLAAFKSADDALYECKRKGRDQVRFAA